MTVVRLIAVDETGREISLPEDSQVPGWIKKSRKLSGMSLQELADKMSVSKQAVYLWEAGSSSPTVERLVKLMTIFSGVDDDDKLSKVDALLLPHASNTSATKK